MLKNYELLYILHPDLEGSSEKIAEKVSAFITKAGGEVTNQEDWGKRKLAYPIAKNDFGVYVLLYFTLDSEKLPEIERDLRLSEEIMRSMIVSLPEIIETKKSQPKAKAKKDETSKATKVEKEEVSKEVPVEEVVAEEKPKKTAAKKAAPKAEKEEVVEEKPKAKKTTKKAELKEEKPEAAEKERLKKLDEKLEEILGE